MTRSGDDVDWKKAVEVESRGLLLMDFVMHCRSRILPLFFVVQVTSSILRVVSHYLRMRPGKEDMLML